MLVALSMRVTEAQNYVERRDSISHDWIDLLTGWDMSPLLLPNTGTSVSLFGELKPGLLILTGGDDLGAFPERDAMENSLLSAALENGTPVLGVCRGSQLINDFLGGGLVPVEGHVAADHAVGISDPWQRFYGDRTTVNSFHATGIPGAGLADELKPAAVDGDGNIEGFVWPGKPVAGVMWHPERGNAPAADRAMIADLAGQGDSAT